MSYPAIIEYMQALLKLYTKANKKEKAQLLDHASKVTGRHRKSLIRLLSSEKEVLNNKTKCGTKTKYPPELLLPHIKYLWNSIERISAKRLKVAFEDWLPLYHENEVNNHIKFLLQKMSVSTLDRFLSQLRKDSVVSKGLSSTSPSRFMKNKVPINTLDSKITSLGFTQADTVAHCGDKLIGDFMNSITLTDISSTWTQNYALYTKKALEVKQGLDRLEKELPFKLKAINTDSGSEFLNIPVFNQFKSKNVIFTRSRPYKKNDNCYVEQKNFTHVRELFGYQRIDKIELKDLMNEIYLEVWNPLQNYFIPTLKIKEKIRIGGKIVKKYGKPETPYQRVMNSNELTEAEKNELTKKKKQLNPFDLKKLLEKKLSVFFGLLKRYNDERKAA